MAAEKVFPRRPMSPMLEQIADGVWWLRGDIKGAMSVFFIRESDGTGVVQFDAGTKGMTKAVKAAGEKLGGIRRIVLGHAHCDHRGSAPGVGAPVYCHPDAVEEAESDVTIRPYWDLSLISVTPVRLIYPILLKRWDGGAVKIAGTLNEGDDVAGFTVYDFSGHAPGMIGLIRATDKLALVTDTIYVADPEKLKPLPAGEATVPHPAFNWDHAKAKESVRKLASLDPAKVYPGHDDPVTENVKATLLAAAEKH